MEVGPQYKPLTVRSYRFWDLLLSDKQRYLGRTYIWWKDRSPGDGENMALDDLPDEALLEVKKIWRDVVRCCRMLGYQTEPYGQNFRLNTAYLANERQHHNGHMHIHFYPRTSENFTSTLGIPTMDENFEKMLISGRDRQLEVTQMREMLQLFILDATG